MKYRFSDGNTPIDESEAEDLIPDYIQFQEELNEFEQNNIIEARKFYLGKDYSYDEILDMEFLKSIHSRMFGETWKWAGNIRVTEKNIGIPPEKILESIKLLLDDTKYWIEQETYSAIEICVRFHHKLVYIHSFPNGNGRHSRFATNLLCKALSVKQFTWGNKELVKKGKERDDYLAAIREADAGDYKKLIKFVNS